VNSLRKSMGQQRVLLQAGREYSKLSFLSYRHATVEPIVALPVLCDVTGKTSVGRGGFADVNEYRRGYYSRRRRPT
jgi:hypothetical protein